MKLAMAGVLLLLAPTVYAQNYLHNSNRNNPFLFADPGAPSVRNWVDMFQFPSASVAPAPITSAPAAPAPQHFQPVSVNDLRIPPKAVKEWERSAKAMKEGNFRASNEHLQKAIQIYPDFFAAHFDLGGNHIRLHEYEQALTEFQTAARIDPNRSYGYHGASVALFLLQRFPEAEASARRALELEPDIVNFHYLLAQTILAQGHPTKEAEKLLHDSEEKFPSASLVLAQLYLMEGRVDDVVTALQSYLRAPEPRNKAAAECWVALLDGVATGSCAANKTFPDFH